MPYSEPSPLPPGQRLVDEPAVRTYGPVPRLAAQEWTLTITGETADGSRFVLGWDDLAALPQREVVADLHCVARTTAQDLRWGGVLARDLVALCPPRPGADHVLAAGQHGYSASLTMADLASPRTLVATSLGGEPLTPEHGGPARLVVPHLYGYKSVKWVREISYSGFPERGFWESRGYHLQGDAWRQERWSYQE